MSDDTKNPHILKASEAHYEDTDISRNDKLRLKAEAVAHAFVNPCDDCGEIDCEESVVRQIYFIAGYLAHAAEAEELVEALDRVENYLNWHTDDLCGDDLIGDGRKTASFKEMLAEVHDATERYRGGKP